MKSVKETKQQLRGHWRSVPAPSLEEKKILDARIIATIQNTPEFTAAKQISLFAPLSWEVDLTPLWDKRSVFPKVIGPDIHFFKASPQELEIGFVGILEPPEKSPAAPWQAGDIVLVPALAWDRMGYRLGSGKGFYDRFLEKLPKGVHRWGVGYAARMSPTPLPRESFDQKVDAFINESEFYRFG